MSSLPLRTCRKTHSSAVLRPGFLPADGAAAKNAKLPQPEQCIFPGRGNPESTGMFSETIFSRHDGPRCPADARPDAMKTRMRPIITEHLVIIRISPMGLIHNGKDGISTEKGMFRAFAGRLFS
jgi:hypothetical protein